MWIQRLSIEGVGTRGLERSWLVGPSLDRVSTIDAGPDAVAVADALALAFASFDAALLRQISARIGLGLAEVHEDRGLPEQISWSHPQAVRALFPGRSARVDVALALDPALFRVLIETAVREPRLVDALSAAAPLEMAVGWHLADDGAVAAVGVLRLAMGGVAIPVAGAERPAWVAGLLTSIGRRFHRVDGAGAPDPTRLFTALHGPLASRRAGCRRALAAVGEPPFSFAEVELVRAPDGELGCWMGEPSRPLRAWGRGAAQALELTEAVWLEQPDVLVLPMPQGDGAQAVTDWLAARTQGDSAPLEQVLFVAEAS